MRRFAFVAAAALALAAQAAPASAQLGIGARIGTLGLGADVTYGLTNRIALRGGIGVIPIEPEGDFTDVTYKIEPPSPLSTLGVDFYVTSGLRLIGGVLFGTDETIVTAQHTGTVTIDGREFSGVTNLTGLVESSSAAPFAGIGLGKGLVSGLNLTFDFGVAFLKEPALTLTASGSGTQSAEFQSALAAEEERLQADLEKYLKYYPILNIAVRFGLGGSR